MFGVIWGHVITVLLAGCQNSIGIHVIMRTYDMPLFMMISGYFLALGFKRKTFSRMLKDKITTILLPTILWSLIASRGKSMFNYYFCYAVFLSSIIIIIGNLMNKNFKVIFLTGIALMLQVLPFKFNMSYLYPFFLLGYFFNVRLIENLKHGGGKYAFAFIFCLCFWKVDYTIWATGEVLSSFDVQNVFIMFFRFFIGYIGSVAFMNAVDYLYTKYDSRNTMIYKFFVKSGKETLSLYILQHIALFGITNKIIVWMVHKLNYNPFVINELLLGYIIAPVYSLFLIYCMMLFTKFIKKHQYTSWMFGFKIK